MVELIYTLCLITSSMCAWALFAGYRKNRYRLLFWSGLCFGGLSFNNLLLILDRIIFPQADMSTWRLVAALLALLALLYGLIWEEE